MSAKIKRDGNNDDSKSLGTLRLWADRSSTADDLQQRLQERGYKVEKVRTAASRPTVVSGYDFVSGYPEIFSTFLS